MTFSSNWVIPCQDGFFQFLISSRNFYCSISVWEYVFSPSFRRYFLLRIESFQHGFWCVHLFQLLKVHNQYVSFSNFIRIQDIVEEYSRKYFLSKLMDSRLVFRGNRMIFIQGSKWKDWSLKWKDWSLKWFFNTCVLRTPLQHTRLAIEAHPGTNKFPPTDAFLLLIARVFRGPIRFPQPPFQWPRSRTATLGKSFRGSHVGLTVPWAVSFFWSYDWPVTQSIATLLEDDPHLRSNGAFHSLRPWVCHHTREPTVVSRVSCRPFFFPECWPFSPALPVTLTHPLLPPLTAGSWAGTGEDCCRRITWRPFTLAGSSVLPPLRLTAGVFVTPTRRTTARR